MNNTFCKISERFEEKIVVSKADSQCLAPHLFVDTTLSFANLACISGERVALREDHFYFFESFPFLFSVITITQTASIAGS